MWYFPNDTLSKQRLFNFDLGARGCGKTTGCTIYGVKQKEKYEPFEMVWLRRYKSERQKIELSFFDKINSLAADNNFSQHTFELKNHIGYMDDIPFIHFAALSVDSRIKGINSPNIELIVFDEFLVDKGQRYLPNEVDAFLSFYDTVARPTDPKRKRCPVLFIANAMSLVNPYFLAFDIRFNEKGKFKSKGVSAQLVDDSEFYNQSKSSEFAKLIEGTNYYKHSIQNEFLLDNNDFIEPKSNEAKHFCSFKYGGKTIGCWLDWERGRVWLSFKFDPCCIQCYSILSDDMQPNVLTSKYFKKTQSYDLLSHAYNTGALFYENAELKNAWYKIIKIVNMG